MPILNKQTPERELDYKSSYGFLRCFEHGAPDPQIRWHEHDEYEIHLITATSGKAFIGDYIGEFEPGNLVLIGPNIPHNWVSNELPSEGIAKRDLILQFDDKPLRKSCELLPELNQILPLLDRAKHGIEFFGNSDFAKNQLEKIKEYQGINSFNEFLTLVSALSNSNDYRILSNTQLINCGVDESIKQLSGVIEHIRSNISSHISMSEIAAKIGMDSSHFSRCFKKATGNTFTTFVNRLRVSLACQLLSETDKYISTICYEVGYNNVANFNRRFSEIKKITPTEYRIQSQLQFAS